jgi:hypothetical protein
MTESKHLSVSRINNVIQIEISGKEWGETLNRGFIYYCGGFDLMIDSINVSSYQLALYSYACVFPLR